MKIAYEIHPCSRERKEKLRAQGFKIIDAQFDPNPKPVKAKLEKPTE